MSGEAPPPSAVPAVPKYKIISLGSASVGKTSIARRFARDEFTPNVITIGVDFYMTERLFGDRMMKLYLWDLAGNDRYPHLISRMYPRHADAVLLVFDITSRASFAELPQLMVFVKENVPTAQCVVVGSKADLAPGRTVTTEEGAAFAALHSVRYFEVSALSGEGVTDMYTDIAKSLPDLPAAVAGGGGPTVQLTGGPQSPPKPPCICIPCAM